MRVFKNRWFERFAAREMISDQSLCRAVRQAESGLIDADLGGGVIKQRIPRPGEGKSGGFRSIVLFRRGELAFFVFGFPKNAMPNIRQNEVRAFKALAEEMLGYDIAAIETALAKGALTEVHCDDQG